MFLLVQSFIMSTQKYKGNGRQKSGIWGTSNFQREERGQENIAGGTKGHHHNAHTWKHCTLEFHLNLNHKMFFFLSSWLSVPRYLYNRCNNEQKKKKRHLFFTRVNGKLYLRLALWYNAYYIRGRVRRKYYLLPFPSQCVNIMCVWVCNSRI